MGNKFEFGIDITDWLDLNAVGDAVADIVKRDLTGFLVRAHLYLSRYDDEGNAYSRDNDLKIQLVDRDSDFELDVGTVATLLMRYGDCEYGVPMSREQSEDTLELAKRYRGIEKTASNIARKLEYAAQHIED